MRFILKWMKMRDEKYEREEICEFEKERAIVVLIYEIYLFVDHLHLSNIFYFTLSYQQDGLLGYLHKQKFVR